MRGIDEELDRASPRRRTATPAGRGAETGRLRADARSAARRRQPSTRRADDRAGRRGALRAARLPAGVRLPAPRRGRSTRRRADGAGRGAPRGGAAHRTEEVLRRRSARCRRSSREHPELAVVHYQLGALLSRTGRFEEAIDGVPNGARAAARVADAGAGAGRRADARRPARRGAGAGRRGGRAGDADQTDAAHPRRGARDGRAGGAGAQGRRRGDARTRRRRTPPTPALPMPQFVRGRLLYDDGTIRGGAGGVPARPTPRCASTAAARRAPPVSRRLAGAPRSLRRSRGAVPRGAARLPAQHSGLRQPGDALPRVEPRRSGRGRARTSWWRRRRRPRATRWPRGCGRSSATARAPRRSGPMRGRASAAIRRWRCSGGMRGDKQQPDRPVQNRFRDLLARTAPASRRDDRDPTASSGASRARRRLVDADAERHELERHGHHAVERLEDDRLRQRRRRSPSSQSQRQVTSRPPPGRGSTRCEPKPATAAPDGRPRTAAPTRAAPPAAARHAGRGPSSGVHRSRAAAAARPAPPATSATSAAMRDLPPRRRQRHGDQHHARRRRATIATTEAA